MSIWIEVVEPFTVKEHGQVWAWQIGQRMALSPEKAQRVIDRVGNKVRVVECETMDHAIGTVVQASLNFLTEAGDCVKGVGPWVVADVVVAEHAPDLMRGRWLLLVHGPEIGWSHESMIAPYHCPACKGMRFWWSTDTVLCVECIPPSVPEWLELWREVAELNSGITPADLRHVPLLEARQQCDEAFETGDYAGFQMGVIRARRATQGPVNLRMK